MELHPIDIGIIIVYLIIVVTLGWLLSRRAGKNLESYFLGGKSIPWYILGVSHGASGFDITGTMWFALMLFVYGTKGTWILWIWPMFSMVFRMMYLGVCRNIKSEHLRPDMRNYYIAQCRDSDRTEVPYD